MRRWKVWHAARHGTGRLESEMRRGGVRRRPGPMALRHIHTTPCSFCVRTGGSSPWEYSTLMVGILLTRSLTWSSRTWPKPTRRA